MINTYRSGEALLLEIERTVVPDNAIAMWNIGQEGYILKGRNQVLVVDPYLTDSIEQENMGPKGLFVRDFPPPVEPSAFRGVNFVLCTHFHQDHLDVATLKPLSNASPGARFVVPASHTHLLTESEIFPSRVVGAKHMEPLELGEFTVWPIAERHQQDEVDEHGNHFYLGYVIRVNGVTVYHSGDTIYFRELADTLREFGIDVALINSNGRDWIRDENEVIGNMNYREAVEFAYTIQADMVVPMHYDLFKSNRENPAYFVDYLFTHHRDLKFHMFAVGERFIYYK